MVLPPMDALYRNKSTFLKLLIATQGPVHVVHILCVLLRRCAEKLVMGEGLL